MKKTAKILFSKQCGYIAFVLAGLAAVFLKNSAWAYGWIAEIYPLKDAFVPTLFCIIAACIAMSFGYVIIKVFFENRQMSKKAQVALNIAFLIDLVLSLVAFIYTFVLVFHLDTGFNAANISAGFVNIAGDMAVLGVMTALILPLMFCKNNKEILKSLIASVVILALVITPVAVGRLDIKASENKLPEIELKSENLLDGAEITYESLKQNEEKDAVNILKHDNTCWTPQHPNGAPAEDYPNVNNSVVEIQLKESSSFNTAVIEEVGNQVQYFRLQALINDEWETIYQSEKIQSMRVCSFDTVSTNKIRLSIDKFRDADTPANIKSIKLYNEPKTDAGNFEVTGYHRIDNDVPTEVLKKGDDYVRNYAKYFDVYSTVILFGAVSWDENGNMSFGSLTEEQFSKEIDALKEIIDCRSNKNHNVKLIVTALADGTGGGHEGVNVYMAEHWQSIADKIVNFVNKYEFDGVDIDWEYPQSPEDWSNYDSFIARLDDGMHETNPDAIISTALSSGNLGLSKETWGRLDQIQFMAYDGQDEDGYQSSLQQAQEGLQAFADNGADVSKINIGIAAYGRPVNLSPYWPLWRDLKEANYWDNKYYNVHDSDQVFECTFCSPALAGDKTAYALMSGAGGVMVFRSDCDKLMDDEYSVTRGVQNALNRYFKNW